MTKHTIKMSDSAYPIMQWGPFGDVDEIITLAPATSDGVSQEEMDAAIKAALATISLQGGGDLTYNLMVNGSVAGTINIPADQFLSNVTYDKSTKTLNFTFEDQGSKDDVSVYVGDLIQEYTAGNGIGITDNKVSVVVDPDTEVYLSVGKQGLKLNGIDATYARKTDIPSLDGYATESWVADQGYLTSTDINGLAAESYVDDAVEAVAAERYTKDECDAKYLTAHQDISEYATTTQVVDMIGDAVRYTDIATDSNPDRKAIVLKNHDAVLGTSKNGSTYNLAMVSKWDVADFGSASLPLNLNSNVRPTWNDGPATAENPSHNGEFLAFLSEIPTNVSELTNDAEFITQADITPYDDTDIKSDIAAAQSDIDLIKSTYATQEWVGNQGYLTEHQSLADYATTAALSQKADASALEAYATLADMAAKQDSLVAGDGIKIEDNTVSCTLDVSVFKYVEELPAIDIDSTKIYVKPNNDGVDGNKFTEYAYTGDGGWEILGEYKAEVDLTPYAKTADVAAEIDELNQSVEALSQVVNENQDDVNNKFSDINDALDTKLDNNALDGYATEDWVTARDYLTEHQSLDGYATEAYVADTHKNSVDYTDIATDSNPDRKAIVLKNHDAVLGTSTDGSTYNLAMVSKWDVADFGSASLPLNLNSNVRPTWNDGPATAENPSHNGEFLAFLSEIPANVSELANDAGYVTADELANGLATKQAAGDYASSNDLATLAAAVATKAESADVIAVNESVATLETALADKADKMDLDGLASKQSVADMEAKIPSVQTGIAGTSSNYVYSGEQDGPNHVVAGVQVVDSGTSSSNVRTYTVKSKSYGDNSYAHTCGTIEVPQYTAGAGITIDANNTIKLKEAAAVESATDALMSTVAANNQAVMSRLDVLEDKLNALSRVNIEPVALDGSADPVALADSDADYVLSGTLSSSLSVTSHSVTISNSTVESNSKLSLSSSDVEVKNVEFSGDFERSVIGNVVMSINDAYDVTIKNVTFTDYTSIYNPIEIGLSTSASTPPKTVLIDNCRWESDSKVHCAVIVFGTADDAVININNCYIKNTYGLLRLSNRTNAKNIVVNITNCQIDNWATLAQQQGFLLCQDYTSTTQEEFDTNNLFGDGKITINIINCTGPDGQRITSGDMSQICGSNTDDQLIYVVGGSFSDVGYIFRTYDDGKYYPTINIL